MVRGNTFLAVEWNGGSTKRGRLGIFHIWNWGNVKNLFDRLPGNGVYGDWLVEPL